MKLFFTILILLISISSYSQFTIFTDYYVNQGGCSDIEAINGELYVGASSLSRIEKWDLSDPNPSPVLVAENLGQPWKLEYSSSLNTICFSNFVPGSISTLDLNQPAPITAQTVITNGVNNGFAFDDTTVYYTNGSSIRKLDLSIGASSDELIFEDTEVDYAFGPGLFGNYLYYMGPGALSETSSLKRLDITDPNPQPEVLIPNITGFPRSSRQIGSQLYFGLSTPAKIFRVDLSATNPQIENSIDLDITDPQGLAINETDFYVSDGASGVIIRFDSALLGNPDIELSNINLFPNPSEKLIYLVGINTPKIPYTIYNLEGRVIERGQYADSGLDVSELSTGVYFLEIQSEGNSQTLKFIRE